MQQKYVLTLPLGMILLTISILMDKYLPSNNILDFIETFLIGLSLVSNLYFIRSIIKTSREE